MTGLQWVVVVLAGWTVAGLVLAGVATLLLTRARRRLVWDDALPALEPGLSAQAPEVEEAPEIEEATA